MGWRKDTLTIPSSGTTSNELSLQNANARRSCDLTIWGAAAFDGTVTVEVAEEPGGTFYTLQSGGSDVSIPAVKATVINGLTAGAIRLKSSTTETAARACVVRGVARD